MDGGVALIEEEEEEELRGGGKEGGCARGEEIKECEKDGFTVG